LLSFYSILVPFLSVALHSIFFFHPVSSPRYCVQQGLVTHYYLQNSRLIHSLRNTTRVSVCTN
jgi:hypothetical protein